MWAIGCLLFVPFLMWVKFLYFPNKEEKKRRDYMHSKRRERTDEQARVTRENLRLARIEDEKRAAAKKVSDLLIDDYFVNLYFSLLIS